MKPENAAITVKAADWLTRAGFTGSVAAFGAGVLDIHEGIGRIEAELIPGLLRLNVNSYDQASDVVIDMITEFEHIRAHAEDALACLTRVREFLEHK